jgi:16S rRNA (adenine1518-N6/adenine1519-N6)-dimethyltransferase
LKDTEGKTGLLGATEIRQLAASVGLVPTKKLGQNFVHDANTVRKIVAKAQLSRSDHVLEVGPGLGSLTLGLLEAGVPVTAVEIDQRLAELLPSTAKRLQPGADLTVIRGDALLTHELPLDATVLVANLPYNTSVPIVLHLLSTLPALASVLVMVQAEVAERLAATPGSKAYGGPSVKAAWFGQWAIAGSVSRQVFWPVPNVDSLLVAMTAKKPPGDEALRKRVWDLVDHAFATRRKMSRGALAGLLGPDQVSDIITEAGLSPESRGEEWTLSQFVDLARVWESRAQQVQA